MGKRGRKRKWVLEDVMRMAGMAKEGQTLRKIGEAFGISRQRVWQLFKVFSITISPLDKNCAYCGAPFRTRNPRYRFCSHLCFVRQRLGRPIRRCAICGTPVLAKHKRLYCSDGCAKIARSEHIAKFLMQYHLRKQKTEDRSQINAEVGSQMEKGGSIGPTGTGT